MAYSFRASTYFGAMACLTMVVLSIAGDSTRIIVLGVGGFLLMGADAYLLLDKQATFDGGPRTGNTGHPLVPEED